MSQPPARLSFSHHLGRFAGELFRVPHWLKVLLGVAAVLVAYSFIAPYLSSATSSTTQPMAEHLHHALTAPWLSRIALSLLVGYVIGALFRMFTGIMAMLALLAAAVYAAIVYFHLDQAPLATAATQEYHQATTWLGTHASHLKSIFTTHLPSTSAATAGLFFGVRQKSPSPI